MSGNGKLVYEDGTIFVGEFKNDMRNGSGLVTQKNGQ